MSLPFSDSSLSAVITVDSTLMRTKVLIRSTARYSVNEVLLGAVLRQYWGSADTDVCIAIVGHRFGCKNYFVNNVITVTTNMLFNYNYNINQINLYSLCVDSIYRRERRKGPNI